MPFESYKNSHILACPAPPIHDQLHWQPKVALEDGLKETIAYFRHSLEIA